MDFIIDVQHFNPKFVWVRGEEIRLGHERWGGGGGLGTSTLCPQPKNTSGYFVVTSEVCYRLGLSNNAANIRVRSVSVSSSIVCGSGSLLFLNADLDLGLS